MPPILLCWLTMSEVDVGQYSVTCCCCATDGSRGAVWIIPHSHRIIEWLGVEGTSRIIKFQLPCHRQGWKPLDQELDQVAQSPIQPGIKHWQGWPTAPLGNLFQLLTTLSVKNFPLASNLNLPSFSLKPFPLLLSLSTFVKLISPMFIIYLWKAAMRSPCSLLCSRLNKPSSFSLPS